MAHLAQIENGVVKQVIVVANSKLLKDGIENEQTGIDFCKSLFGEDTEWIQTSYSGSFRKQYAGIGYSYDYDNDVFISPKPYDSWELDVDYDWQPPVAYPDDGSRYTWDEDNLGWSLIEN